MTPLVLCSCQNCTFKLVNPREASFSDLTGLERVGVINRNTQEKVSGQGREGDWWEPGG